MNLSITREQLVDLMETAIAAVPAPAGPEPTEEELALLAAGRLSSHTGVNRARVLAHVAANPVMARLVSQLHGDLAGPQAPQQGLLRPVVRTLLALAAAVALALGVWRAMDPPRSGPLVRVVPLNARPGAPDYWDQARQQKNRPEDPQWEALRDWVLLAASTTAFVLAIPVAYWALYERRAGNNLPDYKEMR